MTHSNGKPLLIEQLGLSLFSYNHNIQQVEEGFTYKAIIFDHVPTQSEVINRIVTEKYKDGEELAIQRKAILNPELPEFIEYNNFVEDLKQKVKMEYEEI
jgi:hypothetical protein